jgi:shikimate dehydrogenase
MSPEGPVNDPCAVCASEPPRALVILGQPVSHSLSPVFQNAALREAGLAMTYSRREVAVDELARVLEECRMHRMGGNVTMPHKEAVFALAGRATDAARRTGAVNTFWWENDTLVGHNTDVDGVTATLRALRPHGVSGDIVLFGAGGAAAAVLVAITQLPLLHAARVWIVARTPMRADVLLQQTGARGSVLECADRVDWARVGLVVNATPRGMHDDDAPPVPVQWLSAATAVFDLVYRRDGTAWVREAKAHGLVAEDGLRMLVEQGAAAFASWFGVLPSREAMWAALGVARPADHAPRE